MEKKGYWRLRCKIFFLVIWILLVLYPNPLRLFNSVERIFEPPISSEIVSAEFSPELIEKFENMESREIERYILEYIPYQYDWQTFNLPWYYPTVEEVLANKKGDCKSRMVLLASIFEALDRDYEVRYSINHFWVHYEGKPEGHIERDDVFLFSSDEGFQLPNFQWDVTYRSYKNFMDVMPFDKKVLIFAGFFVTFFMEKSTEKLF